MQQDLYDILGVSRGAKAAELKAAFRDLAKALHPDHGGDPERFRLVKMAYDVLSDQDHRQHYDQTGETPEQKAERLQEDARFQAMIGDFLVNLIAHSGAPEFTDILALARQQAQQNIANIEGQVSSMKMLSDRLATVQSRIVPKHGETMLRDVLDERVAKLQHTMEDLALQRTRWIRLHAALEDYLYEVYVESVP